MVAVAEDKAVLKMAAGSRGLRLAVAAVAADAPRLLQIAPEGLEAALVELPRHSLVAQAVPVTPAHLAVAVLGVEHITGCTRALAEAAVGGAQPELVVRPPARGITALARILADPLGRPLAETETLLGRRQGLALEQSHEHHLFF